MNVSAPKKVSCRARDNQGQSRYNLPAQMVLSTDDISNKEERVMFLKSLGLVLVFFFCSLTVSADPVVIPIPVDSCYGSPASPICGHPTQKDFCKEYNRDGISCDDVGFYEGQVGYPWGSHSGKFRCVNGCLAWLGQAQSCKAYNRDGITCDQVGFHDGQVGYPWGLKSGKFRCTSGCLQFIWWW
jgi:hypothetical protein